MAVFAFDGRGVDFPGVLEAEQGLDEPAIPQETVEWRQELAAGAECRILLHRFNQRHVFRTAIQRVLDAFDRNRKHLFLLQQPGKHVCALG